jgi:hypothetical protein
MHGGDSLVNTTNAALKRRVMKPNSNGIGAMISSPVAGPRLKSAGKRGVAIFAKACFGYPSPSKRQKLTATANAFGAPVRPADCLRRCPVPARGNAGIA